MRCTMISYIYLNIQAIYIICTAAAFFDHRFKNFEFMSKLIQTTQKENRK